MFRVLMEDIADFHEKFGLKYQGDLRVLDDHMITFRYRFLVEEAKEWQIAQNNLAFNQLASPQDKAAATIQFAKALDAIIDLLYVALGNAYLQGIGEYQLGQAWDLVHAANMLKVRGPSSRSQHYDIVKPPGWEAPKLDHLVEDHSGTRPVR